jgi:hypothetical protein
MQQACFCMRRWQGKLPRVTIQMPVYLEGLEAVIKPSICSLETAIADYSAHGGRASIFVNDDGLQLLGDADRCRARTRLLMAHPCQQSAGPGTPGFRGPGHLLYPDPRPTGSQCLKSTSDMCVHRFLNNMWHAGR